MQTVHHAYLRRIRESEGLDLSESREAREEFLSKCDFILGCVIALLAIVVLMWPR